MCVVIKNMNLTISTIEGNYLLIPIPFYIHVIFILIKRNPLLVYYDHLDTFYNEISCLMGKY